MNINEAVSVLQEKLKRDKKYKASWMANLTMCFYDAMHDNIEIRLTHKKAIDTANKGAGMFLKLLMEK